MTQEAPEAARKSLPTTFDAFEEASEFIAAGMMSSDPAERDKVSDVIGTKMEQACSEDCPITPLDQIIAFVSIAHGLHRAAWESQQEPDRAEFLHDTGQLFLSYAICEAERLVPPYDGPKQ